MHPSVHLKTAGKCPICGMDLVPVARPSDEPSGSSNSAYGRSDQALAAKRQPDQRAAADQSRSSEFTIPVRRQQRIGVTYAEVRRMPVRLDIRLTGTLEVDQALSFECVSRVDGYIEELRVTSPGKWVEIGQPLMTIYSPDLRGPEQELVNLLKVQEGGSAPPESMNEIIDFARRRLQFLSVGQNEIMELERTRQPTDHLLFRSPFRGVVDQAPMKVGMSVKPGDRLMSVVDLSNLWLWANSYESEVELLKEGQQVEVVSPAFPNRSFDGRISSISPTIDPAKRTAAVRIDVPNPDGQLRPGMYANVVVHIDAGEELAVPVDAVLPTGSRMLAFVDKGSGKLEPRFIQVGRQFLDPAGQREERYYHVISGLREGERVVASANFLVDAEAHIQGVFNDWSEPAESSSKTVGDGDGGSAITSGEQPSKPSR